MRKSSLWKRRFILTVFSATIIMALASPESVQAISRKAAEPKTATYGEYTDQMIIRYKDGTLVRSAADGMVKAQSALSERLNVLNLSAGINLVHHRFMSGNGQVVKLPGRITLAEAESIAEKLRQNPEVEYAEPDRRMRPMLIPNDPLFSSQWHYAAPSAFAGGANLPAAWDITTGSISIVVAVIDTGILPNHADITGRTLAGYNFISDGFTAGNGVGRSADSSDLGDWVAAGACGSGSPPENSSWHGTHVSGTIGANTNNGIGVAGVNWVSPVLPVRALGKCGGFVSDIADGMRWAAGLTVTGVPANANPARVINLSLGGTGSCGITFQTAVNDVVATGVNVIVAAGNEDTNIANASPANCIGVISVAAVGQSGGRAHYSNFGSGVTIAAPGGDQSTGLTRGVRSTINNGLTTPVASPVGDTYAYYQGTSMATPHVAGIVSLMLSLKPSLTPDQILTLLQSTARKFPVNTASLGGDCTTSLCGAGIIDAAAAVASVDRPIISTNVVTSISGTTASSGGTTTSEGGSPVTARGVCWSTASNPTLVNTCTQNGTGPGTFTSSITGLTANTTYFLRAYATNTSGTTYGNERTFFTSSDQFLPKITTAVTSDILPTTAVSGGSVSPDGGAPVTVRGVCWGTTANPTTAATCSSNGAGSGTFNSPISGLTVGRTYHVRAYATNAIGTAYGLEQNFSTSSAPPTILTAAPTLVTNTSAVGGGNVILGGGATITARGVCWSITVNPATTENCTTDGTGTGQFKSSIAGLTVGTSYHVRAYATDINNVTAYGSDLTFTTLAAATIPTITTGNVVSSRTTTSASGSGNVVSDGGDTVTARGLCWGTLTTPALGGAGATCQQSGSGTGSFTGTLSGLTTNTLYFVRAFATNFVGTRYGSSVGFRTGKRPAKFLLFAP